MKKVATEEEIAAPARNRVAPNERFTLEELRGVPTSKTPSRPRSGKRQRLSYTRLQKLVIGLALVAALVAALPIGAYLLMQMNEQQQHQQQTRVGITPTAVPTESPAQREARFINQMISQMSLAEELGQMMIVEFDNSSFNSDLQTEIVNQHIGGLILYGTSVESITQASTLNSAAQAQAKIPLFISIDQEGGCVNRLKPITGPRPAARDVGATNNPNAAYEQGVSDAVLLKQVGVNLNLAPDVDVQTVSDAAINSIASMVCFGTRMYGATAQVVATYAGAYLNGLQGQGVIGTLKHFPGLGSDDTVDPHDAIPVLNRSQTDLTTIDFAPYRTLLAEGNVDMIMTTHELVPAYDVTWPTSLSPTMIDQVLRKDLGYQGVVITDTLHMGAITSPKPAGMGMSMAQAGVQAVIAGNDLLLGPYNPSQTQAMLDALTAAVNSGQITKARIDLSMQRILALKIKYGMITIPASFQ